MTDDIAEALKVYRSSPYLEDIQIYRELLNRGIGRFRAARIVEFAPSAYCRILLEKSGVQFPETYQRLGLGMAKYSDSASWTELTSSAREEVKNGVSKEDFLMIAGRSAEYQAVNQLLGRGSKLENIALMPVLLPWPEEGPDCT